MVSLKSGWKRMLFADMVTSVGATRKARGWTADEGGVDRYVGLEHLDANSPKIRRWGTPETVGENSDLRHFETGDVILARRGIEQRKVGVAEFRGVASGHALVFRARPEVMLPEYLPYFLLSDAFMNRALEFSAGSLSKTVNLSALMKQEFALPPMSEQRRLISVFGAVYAMQSANHELVQACRNTSRAIAADTFFGDERIPVQDTLGSVCDSICVGIVIKPAQYYATSEAGIPALIMKNVQRGRLDLTNVNHITPAGHQAHPRSHLRAGDVVAVRSSGSEERTGDAAVVLPALEGANCIDLLVLRPGKRILPHYLCAYLNAPTTRGQLLARSTGTMQKHLNVGVVKTMLIPVPSLEVQKQVTARLAALDDAARAAQERLEATERLMKELLQLAWSSN